LTLAEAGIKNPKSHISFLKSGHRLRRYVLCANADNYKKTADKTKLFYKVSKLLSLNNDSKEILDYSTAKFYIPKENVSKAELYYSKEKSNSFLVVIICAVILGVAMFLLSKALPSLLNMLDEFLTSIQT